MSLIKRFLSVLFFGLIFASVIYFVTPPTSWMQASILQILLFFIPLLLFLTFFINLLLKYLPFSFIISCATIMTLVFYSINMLNWLSGILILLTMTLILRLFPKLRYPRFRLTKQDKIPRLTHVRKH